MKARLGRIVYGHIYSLGLHHSDPLCRPLRTGLGAGAGEVQFQVRAHALLADPACLRRFDFLAGKNLPVTGLPNMFIVNVFQRNFDAKNKI